MEISDFDDEDLESVLSDYPKAKLIEVIKILRKENDELKGVQRSPMGEQIVSDDEIINDEEEIIT